MPRLLDENTPALRAKRLRNHPARRCTRPSRRRRSIRNRSKKPEPMSTIARAVPYRLAARCRKSPRATSRPVRHAWAGPRRQHPHRLLEWRRANRVEPPRGRDRILDGSRGFLRFRGSYAFVRGRAFPAYLAQRCFLLARRVLGLTAALLTASACNYPKPPAAWGGAVPAPTAAAPTAVASAPPPPPPPPPPPKCEDLAENCSAGPDTKLLVGDSGAWFTPPEGWHYARGSSGSIAVHPDGTAMIILEPSPDPSDIAPAVEAMVSERGVKGLKVDKLKHRLKKPQQTLPAGEGSVDLWEVDKGQQGEALSLRRQGQRHVAGAGRQTRARAHADRHRVRGRVGGRDRSAEDHASRADATRQTLMRHAAFGGAG